MVVLHVPTVPAPPPVQSELEQQLTLEIQLPLHCLNPLEQVYAHRPLLQVTVVLGMLTQSRRLLQRVPANAACSLDSIPGSPSSPAQLATRSRQRPQKTARIDELMVRGYQGWRSVATTN